MQLDSNLIHSNVPPKLLDDPSRWYTVDGLLKLVENSGYREVSQVRNERVLNAGDRRLLTSLQVDHFSHRASLWS